LLGACLVNFILVFSNNGWDETQNPLSTNQTVTLSTGDITVCPVSQKVAEIPRSLSFFSAAVSNIVVLFVYFFTHIITVQQKSHSFHLSSYTDA
jgi:hypothetical protein